MSDTYSFGDVNASIAGPGGAFPLASDAGNADEGITINANGDINTMTTGPGGAVMHSLHLNRDGQVSVKVLKTSPLNALLSLMYNLQTNSSALHGRNVITIGNIVTGDVVTCSKCAFKKAPDLAYAKEGGIIDWMFDAGVIIRVLGNLN